MIPTSIVICFLIYLLVALLVLRKDIEEKDDAIQGLHVALRQGYINDCLTIDNLRDDKTVLLLQNDRLRLKNIEVSRQCSAFSVKITQLERELCTRK